jgi:hypothetical protein
VDCNFCKADLHLVYLQISAYSAFPLVLLDYLFP